MTKKNLTIFGEADSKAVAQIERCLEDEQAALGALMADNHMGYSMPIGGVIAYENAISPSGVGFDIACGNMAVKTNLSYYDLRIDGGKAAKGIMRGIQKKVAFGMGRSNPEPVDHDLFYDALWPELLDLSPGLLNLARDQLGTVGSGNHYVDLLVDEEATIWVANHFGSRGLGHKIASGFLNLAVNEAFTARLAEREDPTVLSLDTDLGQFYQEAMQLAGRYAYAGREYVVQQVLDILGATAVETVHNHHNFAWEENGLWVVRKGATPLTNQSAFIGGSMGDISVIVRGLRQEVRPGGPCESTGCGGDPTRVVDIGALGSAPHGAGRIMSRTAAAGKLRKMWICPNHNCDLEPFRTESGESGHEKNKCPKCGIPLRRERMRDTSKAAIDWDASRADLTARGIVVLGAGADEAPGVYKDLRTVLNAHANIEIMHTFEPLGVVMAGPDSYDPYKD